MMRLSSIYIGSTSQFDNKGSTYGKAISASNSYSFQESPGNGGLNNQDRVQVLYVKTTIFSPVQRSIIVVNESTRGPNTYNKKT